MLDRTLLHHQITRPDSLPEGDGLAVPVLYLPGTGSDLRRPANPLERRLASQFELLRLDLRGMGQSPVPPGPWCMQDFAYDVLQLLDALGWARCQLVGYSFGGMVAQELALLAPERFSRLMLLSSTAGGAGGLSYPLHELLNRPLPEQAEQMVLLADVRRTQSWREQNTLIWQSMVVDTLAGLTAVEASEPLALGRRLQLAARAQHDCWARLPQLAGCLPIHVLAGEFDGLAPPRFQQALAKQCGAQFQTFAGGHLFFTQVRMALDTLCELLQNA